MQIQPNERDKIAFWLAKGKSQRFIANNFGRSQSSISDEINRNSYHGIYEPNHAQRVAAKRKSAAGIRHPLKDPDTFDYVTKRLRRGWSPELIDGRLKLKNGYRVISYECIYQYIYSQEAKSKKWWEYLPLKRKKRKKKQGRNVQKERIADRVSIHLREESIETRETFGHYEGDSIIGRQTKGKVIHTEVERKTRYLEATVINSKSSQDTLDAQIKIFSQIPTKSVTTDNGLEFAKHQQLKALGISTFFADPYSSWQRGTNENTNRLIRRYLPKKTSFNNLTQKDLDDIVWEINNRPKKVLNFATPQEAFNRELSIIQGDRN